MRYLIKFNESKVGDLKDLLDDINACFAELMDDGLVDSDHSEYTKDNVFVNVYLDDISNPESVEDYLNIITKRKELLEDITIAIKRLKDNWPNVNVDLTEFDSNEYFSLRFNLSEVIEGEFYTKRVRKYNKDGSEHEDTVIRIDSKKLKVILKLRPLVSISNYESNGKEYLSFRFLSKADFYNHIYRDGEVGGDNSTTKDAFVINPQLMKQYQEMGEGLKSLKIDGKKICTGISNIQIGEKQRYYGMHGEGSRQVWSIDIEVNNEFKYEMG